MRRRNLYAALTIALGLLVAVPFVATGDDGRSSGAHPSPTTTAVPDRGSGGDTGSDVDGGGATTNDQVIADDLIVDGSACVGFDCVNGESFGFDTIRLKENNLRIRFVDTSNSASFPTVDWQITINDSSNGGASYFGIEDMHNSRFPFRVEANARTDAFVVDTTGNIGIGTRSPVLDLHVKTGDTPSLRFEQDGSSGFTAQTWDLAGNEANFFIRDATNGSTLPFRIEPGTASNTLYLDNKEFVGFNNTSPTHQIHAKGTSSLNNEANETAIKVENTSATSARRYLLQLENFGHTGMRLYDSDRAAGWIIVNQATDLRFRADASTSWPFILDADGNLTIAGDLTADGTLYASDASRKSGFTAVDPASVLAGVRSLTIGTWTWVDGDGTLHMGPTAQEFAAAFGLGGTDTAIDAADVNGVTLAAIQALAAENDDLRARVAALEALVAALLADG